MCCNVTTELRAMGFTVPHVQKWRGEHNCWAHNFYYLLRSEYLIKWLNHKNERPNSEEMGRVIRYGPVQGGWRSVKTALLAAVLSHSVFPKTWPRTMSRRETKIHSPRYGIAHSSHVMAMLDASLPCSFPQNMLYVHNGTCPVSLFLLPFCLCIGIIVKAFQNFFRFFCSHSYTLTNSLREPHLPPSPFTTFYHGSITITSSSAAKPN